MYLVWNNDHRIALAKRYGKRHAIQGDNGGYSATGGLVEVA